MLFYTEYIQKEKNRFSDMEKGVKIYTCTNEKAIFLFIIYFILFLPLTAWKTLSFIFEQFYKNKQQPSFLLNLKMKVQRNNSSSHSSEYWLIMLLIRSIYTRKASIPQNQNQENIINCRPKY